MKVVLNGFRVYDSPTERVFPTAGTCLLQGDSGRGKTTLFAAVAWALYGVGLLVVGVRLENVALRWLSLALVLVTAGKVFLWDLGRLGEGRLYGRVFRRERREHAHRLRPLTGKHHG